MALTVGELMNAGLHSAWIAVEKYGISSPQVLDICVKWGWVIDDLRKLQSYLPQAEYAKHVREELPKSVRRKVVIKKKR